jgi:hypothetical protein
MRPRRVLDDDELLDRGEEKPQIGESVHRNICRCPIIALDHAHWTESRASGEAGRMASDECGREKSPAHARLEAAPIVGAPVRRNRLRLDPEKPVLNRESSSHLIVEELDFG